MNTILLTGFPGFLGSSLLPRMLRHRPESRAVCVVQPRFAVLAKERVQALTAVDGRLADRVELVEGDITAGGLGLADPGDLQRRTSEILHLAAVYDLEVPRDLGMRVNVHGTANVLRFAQECPNLRRHHYVSTCYVSGRYTGPYRETDLDVGQRFNNFYEETKFLAEVEVAQAREAGMPTTVYRPAIVVGDSRSGETQKFDGPYFLLQWLLRQGRTALIPLVGDPSMVRFNMVPSDFVVDAIEHLSGLDSSEGRTYQLADPHPLTVDELLTEMCRATGQRGIRIHLPARLTHWALEHIGPVERFVGIPAAAVDYFVHPTHYDTTVAQQDLGTAVTCPPVSDYLDRLVDYQRRHRGEGLGVMI